MPELERASALYWHLLSKLYTGIRFGSLSLLLGWVAQWDTWRRCCCGESDEHRDTWLNVSTSLAS